MQIFVNSEAREVPDSASMTDLIALLGLTGQRLAVEVNEELVPRSSFGARRLAARDRVEIIHAVGGG